jgi:hypothetical protein
MTLPTRKIPKITMSAVFGGTRSRSIVSTGPPTVIATAKTVTRKPICSIPVPNPWANWGMRPATANSLVVIAKTPTARM